MNSRPSETDSTGVGSSYSATPESREQNEYVTSF